MNRKRFYALLLLLLPVLCLNTRAIRIEYGPYLQDVGDTYATIVWVTDSVSIGWVEIAPDDGTHYYRDQHPRFFDSVNGVKREGRVHTVKVEGLKPGTSYRYRVRSREIVSHKGISVVYGRETATGVWGTKVPAFTTLDPTKSKTSFVVLNDIHGRQDDVPALLNSAGISTADFVIFNGDMVSHSSSEKQIFEGFMNMAVKTFAREKCMYYARGNHETRGTFATLFQNYFSPTREHLYFTFRQGPVFFIVLDTGEDKPDDDIDYYGIVDYDYYRTRQAEWLKKVVASEEFRAAPYKVVVGHMPPVGFENDPVWHGCYEVEQKFGPVLDAAGVDLYLAGHYHWTKNEYYYFKPDAGHSYPVLVNECITALRVDADEKGLHLTVSDKQGKELGKEFVPRK